MNDPIRVDDMHAHPVSDGSYLVTLGDSTTAILGSVVRITGDWWAAFRFHPALDDGGRYYGDAAPPEMVGTVTSLEDAVRAFGAREQESPPS